MTDLEAIRDLHELLQSHRRTLFVLLKQQAQLGAAHAPPGTINSIIEARAEIARIKHFLRSRGEQIDDLPSDETEVAASEPSLSQSVNNGIGVIIEKLSVPFVREAAFRFRVVFEQACRQIQVINFFKKLHDEFQELEVLLHRLEDDRRQIERGAIEWDSVTIFEEMQEKIEDFRSLVARSIFDTKGEHWVQQLDHAAVMLRDAVAQEDSQQVELVARRINRVLDREPARTNTRLVSAAEDLLFTALATALTEVHHRLTQVRFDMVATRQIETSIGALTTLNTTLQQSVRNHQQWQYIDDELRRVEANLAANTHELELALPDLQIMVVSTYGNNTAEWALTLNKIWSELENALISKVFDKIRPQFRKYRRKASRRFRQVDDELLTLCNELQKIGTSLSLLLRALE